MPQSIHDLGRIVKTKYPGQYDDLADDEVGRRVKAKFPGSYDDFADASPTLMESRREASRSQFESNLPESTMATRTLGMLEGAGVDPESPILGTAKNLATGAVKTFAGLNFGNPMDRLRTVKDLFTSTFVDPVQEFVGGAASGDYDRMARGTGGIVSGTLPGIYGGAKSTGAIAKAAINPESLMTRAANLRAKAATPQPDSIPMTKAGMVGGAARAAINPTRTARASAYEGIARRLSSGDQPRPVADAPPLQDRPDVEMANPPLPADYGVDVLEQRPTYPPSDPIEMTNAPLPPSREFALEQRPAPAVSPEIEMTRPVPPASSTAPASIQTIERGIAPVSVNAKRSTLTNAPRLAQVAPEIINTPPGPAFDRKLVNAFRRVESGVDDAEKLVPRETIISNQPIVEGLGNLAAELAENGLQKSANAVQAIADDWAKLGDAIPWETFRDRKRAFFRENKTTSSPMRRAYGILMGAADQVAGPAGEGLKIANQRYSIVRTALDDALIDIKTGRRIRSVGKPLSNPTVERVKRIRDY